MPDITEKVESMVIKYTKSVLEIKKTVRVDKLRLTLNKLEERILLWVLMENTLINTKFILVNYLGFTIQKFWRIKRGFEKLSHLTIWKN
mgnify:CR=1 FL=1